MIDVSLAVLQRLVAVCGPQFAFVGGLADFAALADMPRSVPAAYVIPMDERAEPNEVYGASVQHHTLTMGVVLIVRYAGDASGMRATLALADLREAVHTALVGWAPPGCNDYLQYQGGTLVELMEGGAVAWRDDFTAQRRVQRPAQT